MRRLSRTDWLALGLLALYVVIFSTLTIREHLAFNTNALDLGKFDQSIWNTSQGRPFAITIGEDSVLQSHFSPALALFAPLYWIWPDIRLLFVAQAVLMGGAGFLIYLFFRRDNPWLGLIVFAAYLMHPSLHQVNLVEFRRLTPAVFATSFALYHLLKRQYGWMALGLGVALLSKEDMSFTAVAFGLYILFVQKQWKVGLATLLAGVAWFVLVPFVLLPRIMPHDAFEGYQHAGASYGYLGESLGDILRTLVRNPGVLFEYVLDPKRLAAVVAFLWPAAFLFLLAPPLALFMLPHFAYLLAATDDTVGRLQAWYPSVLLVLLFWAVAVGVSRLKGRWQRAALAALLVTSALGWLLQSPLWPGSRWNPDRYGVAPADRAMVVVLRAIPRNAIVMAQDPFVPHLSHREQIYLYPWVRGGNQPDYLVLSPDMRSYPVEPDPFRSQFNDVLAGSDYALDAQVGSLYVFRYDPDAPPANPLKATFGDGLRLRGYDTAVAEPDSAFGPVAPGQTLPAGSVLRVALLWEAVAPMAQNDTVFVHVVDGNGRLLAQHDSWPANGFRPTSVLPVGERVRDVHLITLPEAVAADDLALRIGVYESGSGEVRPLANGDDALLVEMVRP